MWVEQVVVNDRMVEDIWTPPSVVPPSGLEDPPAV
jgi:hypothetical protein